MTFTATCSATSRPTVPRWPRWNGRCARSELRKVVRGRRWQGRRFCFWSCDKLRQAEQESPVESAQVDANDETWYLSSQFGCGYSEARMRRKVMPLTPLAFHLSTLD